MSKKRRALKTAGLLTGALPFGYLWMIMPRVWRKPDRTPLTKCFYAHRGLHDNLAGVPENSMAAFARAADAGFGIELDIRLAKDGTVVVFHDDTLKRVCGAEGKVCDYTWEELGQFPLCGSQERIPRLEDVLGLVDGRVPLIVEFKLDMFDLSLCPTADAILREYQGPYCMESFHPLGLFWYRRHRPDICRGQLSDAFLREGEHTGALYFMLQHLLFNFIAKPDFIAYHRKYPHTLSAKICRKLYRSMAAAWTIRSREELERVRGDFDLFIFEGFLPKPLDTA